MDTTTLILPKELLETLDEIARRKGTTTAELMRDALAAYVADEIPVEPIRPSWLREIDTGVDDQASNNGAKHFASLGAGESTVDDGYDSTNIKDWIRKTWNPE